MRVLEIGCGPGVAAREVAKRIGSGFVLGVDRSRSAIEQAAASSPFPTELLEFRVSSVEELEIAKGERKFDIAVAIRVGALDGRHPESERLALERIKRALKPTGRLFIDGGDPLREVPLPK